VASRIAVVVRRVVLVGIALGLCVAIAFGVFHRDIEAPEAAAMATKLLAQYQKSSGESLLHLGRREDRQWADGWEFRWRYKPCPEMASLRIWISRDGRRARYAELPDCAPNAGIGVNPLKV
jgi:hypothetical protein